VRIVRIPNKYLPRCAALVWGLLNVALFTATAQANPALAVRVMQAPYAWKGDCRLCHQEPIGRAGTATQPFAEALKDQGLNGASGADDLKRVLEEWDEQDSDGDGFSDVEELLTGGDPNRGKGEAPIAVVEYRYGCLNFTASAPGSFGAHASWLLLLAACVARSRTRSQR
jgi:hypothetical protein